MVRTKKLNSKISKKSKSKRANKKKNVRISKKKGGGGNRRLSMTPGRLPPGRVARSLTSEREGRVGKNPGVKAKGFFERQIERKRRERDIVREEIVNEAASRYSDTLKNKYPSYNLNADDNFRRAKVALEYLLEVSLEYRVFEDAGEQWIKFLISTRFMRRPGEIMLNSFILEHLKQLFYVLKPHYKGQILQFLQGPAQTGDYVSFTDMGYMGDSKAYPTWLKEQLEENLPFLMRTSVFQAAHPLPRPQ